MSMEDGKEQMDLGGLEALVEELLSLAEWLQARCRRLRGVVDEQIRVDGKATDSAVQAYAVSCSWTLALTTTIELLNPEKVRAELVKRAEEEEE